MIGDTSEGFVFFLPRPTWQPDEQVQFCQRCHGRFSLFMRKHHCRHCGMIFCHQCSSRQTPLRQLGYQEKVRVCDICFEMAYLISYILHTESASTQLHGARGLYELLIRQDDGIGRLILRHGGLEAFLVLAHSALPPEIHQLSIMAFRFLLENDHLLQPPDAEDRTFLDHALKVLFETLTNILESYLLLPEISCDGDDSQSLVSVQGIIFNSILAGSRLLAHPRSSVLQEENLLIRSRWTYLLLDAMEQSMTDVTSKDLILKADSLEIHVVASNTIRLLCDRLSVPEADESYINLQSELQLRIRHILSSYPEIHEGEKIPRNHLFRSDLPAVKKNLQEALSVLSATPISYFTV